MKNIFSRINPAPTRCWINNRGFTLIELMVVIGILAILVGFTTISLTNVQQKTSINTTIQTIISDMKEQQIKAMIGDTEGRLTASAYGVHFDSSQYVLFNGSAYSSSDPSNFSIPLSSNLQCISCTPPTDIIFLQVSGELAAATSITIKSNGNNEERTIELNQYGVVTAVN